MNTMKHQINQYLNYIKEESDEEFTFLSTKLDLHKFKLKYKSV